ncbi:exo-beta-N-acetylmuramidase NamZ family protein [Halomicrococcus sp. NG-SE-24]|uniref:exo-beta-N-acetylmuramidase NamZ family protein n=1 Tax=Halomicrococcus sp. NG-SE-24 TaxID=3436928 RepID=UPI003D9A02FA
MVRLGIESLISNTHDRIAGERIGLVTNPSGVTRNLTPTIDLLFTDDDVELARLFAPEHGIRGNAQADVDIGESVDEQTGLPVYSFNGDNNTELPEKLANLDTLIYDMQDIGCRFYALIYTLSRALEGVADTDTRLLVLDRPNPLGPLEAVGNLAPPLGASPANGYELPVVHGMTVGELASYFNDEYDIGASVEILEMDGWSRDMWFDQTDLPWVLPSPNMPTLTTATLYPGTCFFEGTNLSEGRGTTKPFELVGAPWIDADEWSQTLNSYDLPGVGFRPAYFTPMFSKHERRDIEGVQVHILDRDTIDPVNVGITMVLSAFTSYPEADWLHMGDEYFIDQLSGGSHLRKIVEDASSEVDASDMYRSLRQYWSDALDEFVETSSDYIRY